MSERMGIIGLPDREYLRDRKEQAQRTHEIEFARRKLNGINVKLISNDEKQIYGRPYVVSSDPDFVWVLHR